jgi:hypothetical protein
MKLKQRFTKDEAAKAEHRGPDDAAVALAIRNARHGMQSQAFQSHD